MTIGKRIETIRKENGLTVDEFASVLKVTPQTVRFWEQDKILIRLVDAVEICKVFRVQMNWLAGFSGGIIREVSDGDDR